MNIVIKCGICGSIPIASDYNVLQRDSNLIKEYEAAIREGYNLSFVSSEEVREKFGNCSCHEAQKSLF